MRTLRTCAAPLFGIAMLRIAASCAHAASSAC